MKSLINGMNFMLEYVEKPLISKEHTLEFPYLLVCIGSGDSIILVKSSTESQRIGGSIIGGGTLLGLGNLLISENKFENLLKMAETGDNTNVDTMMREVMSPKKNEYQPHVISSSFGKTCTEYSLNISEEYKKEDISSSLVNMIAVNIGHISTLYANIYKATKYTII